MILTAEEQFAREVTLGVVISRPPSAWHYIIPGMFIFDFLHRGSAIRQYTRHFMFPRKLAVDAARAIVQGEEKASANSHIEADASAWLNSLNLYSPDLLQAHVAFIDVLIDHYSRLLNAQGDSYSQLIEDAYQKRDNFQAFLKEITAAEQEVDRQVIEKIGENEKVQAKLLVEQQQIAKRRSKMLGEIFIG